VGNNNDGERDWRKEDEKKEKEERSGVTRLLSLSLATRGGSCSWSWSRETPLAWHGHERTVTIVIKSFGSPKSKKEQIVKEQYANLSWNGCRFLLRSLFHICFCNLLGISFVLCWHVRDPSILLLSILCARIRKQPSLSLSHGCNYTNK
jgi:hypothetical protein